MVIIHETTLRRKSHIINTFISNADNFFLGNQILCYIK
jgi:hypothetical protein